MGEVGPELYSKSRFPLPFLFDTIPHLSTGPILGSRPEHSSLSHTGARNRFSLFLGWLRRAKQAAGDRVGKTYLRDLRG
jgi:hypothetical protein